MMHPIQHAMARSGYLEYDGIPDHKLQNCACGFLGTYLLPCSVNKWYKLVVYNIWYQRPVLSPTSFPSWFSHVFAFFPCITDLTVSKPVSSCCFFPPFIWSNSNYTQVCLIISPNSRLNNFQPLLAFTLFKYLKPGPESPLISTRLCQRVKLSLDQWSCRLMAVARWCEKRAVSQTLG